MEDADRRTTGSTRVSLDSVVVQLEQGDASFEADGKDLGPGGLALRAACLPDVGARLRCRFVRAPGERPVEAQAEVVWADDAGGTGEFGIRFVALDSATRAALRGPAGPVAAPYVPPPPRARASAKRAASEVAVRLDGSPDFVRGTVLHDDSEGMIFEQPLPFLKLQAGLCIERDGRRGRIGAVDLILDGDTPRLVLDIAFDAPDADPALRTLDEEVTWERVVPEPPLAESDPVEEPAGADAWDDTLVEPVIVSPPAAECVAFEDADTETPMEVPARGPACADEEVAHLMERRQRCLRALHDARSKLSLLRASTVALGAGLWATACAWAGPAMRRLRAQAQMGFAKVGPMVAPLARKLPAMGLKRTRRRTSPPPARANFLRGGSGPTRPRPTPTRARRRTLLLSLLAFSAVAALVAALAPGADAPALPVDVTPALPVTSAEIAPALAAPELSKMGVQPPAAATPSNAAAPSAPALSPLAQLPAGVAREVGPMAPPTFPTMTGGAPPEVAVVDEVARAEAAPIPVEAPAMVTGSSFGSESVRGRSFLIRMSQPVSVIRGVQESDGFRVVIPDSLSLDRASPIAAAHPLVERATILNRGDHAELVITFVHGREPAYRVVARERAIEVVIGRRPARRSS